MGDNGNGNGNGHELKEGQQESQVLPGDAADAASAHVPAPAQPPIVDAIADPPTPQDEGLEQLKETVTALATAVATLTETVTGLLPKDVSPASKPWTHYGSKDNGNGNGESGE